MGSPISSKNFYNLTSNTYQNTSFERDQYLSTIDQFVRKELITLKELFLLDIGAGNGIRTKKLLSGLEYKKLMLIEESSVFADELLNKFNKNEVFNGSVEDYKASGEIYNSAICLWNVISHVQDPLDFLNSINKSLDQNGVFIFDFNNRLNIKEYGLYNVVRNWLRSFINKDAGRFSLKKDGIETSVYIFQLAEIKKLLYQTGFVIEKTFFVNYGTGFIEKTQFSGQILLICRKEC